MEVGISKMNNALDWDDYRIVLMIADAGSLSKAARKSGLSHPTMFRRINTVEEKLGVRLFERFRHGYQPTAAGEEIVTAARHIAELTNATERQLSGRDLRPSGIVRIATTDTLLFALLGTEIAGLQKLEPGITPEILVSNEVSDLSLREADIAIRPTSRPDEHLVGRKLGVIRQGIYAHKKEGLSDKFRQDPRSLPWLGPSPAMPYGQLHAWMKSTGYDKSCVCRMDSMLGLYSGVRSGIGVALLPTYLADQNKDLILIGEPVKELAVDLWMLTHADLSSTARVRAVLDHFGASNHLRSRLEI